MSKRVLVIDDHPEMVALLADHLRDSGMEVEVATSGAAAVALLRPGAFDCVVTDLRMAQVDGLDVLTAAQKLTPAPPVLVMTAFGGVESAVEAMRRGAYHYLTKPFRLDEVLLLVLRAIEEFHLRAENTALRAAASQRTGLGAMIGRSAPMQELFALIERVAHSPAPALIRGESGSGKDLVAQALHFMGPRRERQFVPVNCTALPSDLLESELFGHAKGSFTGAAQSRRGLFREADGGTLFLDEIGDMAPDLQSKLLRVIETGELRSVGSDERGRVNVRLVAATHQDLEQRVAEGRFRHDLFFRLNVIPLRVPPLRERRDDIPLLAQHFVARARERNPLARVHRLSAEVIDAFRERPWPGNIRELENVVERLIVLGADKTGNLALLKSLSETSVPVSRDPRAFLGPTDPIPLRQLENDYISWVVRHCEGNKTRAAELLGIDVSTIHRKERERAPNR